MDPMSGFDILCLNYRPVKVHCCTKDAYTFEITFLALKTWPCPWEDPFLRHSNILNLCSLANFWFTISFFLSFPTDSCNILYYLMAVMEYLLSTKPSRLRLENQEILIQFISLFIFKVQDKSFLT